MSIIFFLILNQGNVNNYLNGLSWKINQNYLWKDPVINIKFLYPEKHLQIVVPNFT